jgi:hypothetical protein
MSDGVWLAKKGQKNRAHASFLKLLDGGAGATVCMEHLKAAGIAGEELVEGLNLTKKTFKDLVDNVMEKWDRVVVV